jgi:hypothetical protein
MIRYRIARIAKDSAELMLGLATFVLLAVAAIGGASFVVGVFGWLSGAGSFLECWGAGAVVVVFSSWLPGLVRFDRSSSQ